MSNNGHLSLKTSHDRVLVVKAPQNRIADSMGVSWLEVVTIQTLFVDGEFKEVRVPIGKVTKKQYEKNERAAKSRLIRLLNDALALGEYMQKAYDYDIKIEKKMYRADIPATARYVSSDWDELNLDDLIRSLAPKAH